MQRFFVVYLLLESVKVLMQVYSMKCNYRKLNLKNKIDKHGI